MTLHRESILPERELPPGREVLEEGASLARDWTVGRSAFQKYFRVADEMTYKQQCMERGRIMQHAHLGYRDPVKSKQACREIHEAVASRGGRVDRYGICLDWSMGYPRSEREGKMQGTGLILDSPESFVEIADAAPVATHFGDFMLGFPAALENTCAALAAGSTVIGNLGQYFTFRLEGSDDITATRSTLAAIGLIAAQPETVMIHSNLDDGFAAVFEDLSCALGAVLLERHIVENLVGGKMTHCFGHHCSTPILRMGFQLALSRLSTGPGSMIYGNTASYRGSRVENFASLGSYLMVDMVGQIAEPSGHAVNPVPVTENERIPEIEEIIDAQCFALSQVKHAKGYLDLIDFEEVEAVAGQMQKGAEQFFDNTMNGFKEMGLDMEDPFELLLAIRRIGGNKLEQMYGIGEIQEDTGLRQPVFRSDTVRELERQVRVHLSQLDTSCCARLSEEEVIILTASTDVHEHGKRLIEGVLNGLGVRIVDGGISAEPDELARMAEEHGCSGIALSTYNGVALTYFCRLRDELVERGFSIPVMIGGQLSEIPVDSTESLPVDVGEQLAREGACPCRSIDDMLPVLLEMVQA